MRSIGMSMSICLSVLALFENDTAKLHQIFVYVAHVAYSRGSVLWLCCDMLCTSGFVDDGIFLHNGPSASCGDI